MTRIINGVAQPDIVARKGDEVKYIFVETPQSLEDNRNALLEAWQSITHKEPYAEVFIKLTAKENL